MTLKQETANEVSAFDAAAIRNEMGRIRSLFEDHGDQDAEDLISYARHVVELRTAASRTLPLDGDVVERVAKTIYANQFMVGSDQVDIDELWGKDRAGRDVAFRQARAALSSIRDR